MLQQRFLKGDVFGLSARINITVSDGDLLSQQSDRWTVLDLSHPETDTKKRKAEQEFECRYRSASLYRLSAAKRKRSIRVYSIRPVKMRAALLVLTALLMFGLKV